MVHLTADGVVTTCGHPVGELAADTFTTDPDLADCFDCESLWGRPQDAAAVATAYAQGFADGRGKSFLELEGWRPADHVRGCGCRLCTVARGIVNQVLGQQAWK